MNATKYRLPRTFRSLGTLRVLNILALAGALAAGTGSVFGHILDHGTQRPAMASTAISTFLVALVWARVMRSPRPFMGLKVRAGWVWSVPLAALNGALSLALLAGSDGRTEFLQGFVIGGTIGAILWIPGLLAVLALYGYPIARAQALAEKGLAGEERGERFIGLVSAVIALGALFVVPVETPLHADPSAALGELGLPLVVAFAAIACFCGVTAAALATYRDRVRRAFVQEVEQGAVEGFRVDATDEGKVLVRVTSQGGGYRAASFEEQVYGLDEGGEARRALTSES